MVLLRLLIASSSLRDEPCQDLDGEGLVLLVQGLPGIGFVEEKIEEVRVFFLQVCSPWGRGSTVLAGCWSEAAEESIYHGPCMKQVLLREPSVVVVGLEESAGRARSVQSAGIRDLLPSGRIRTRCNRPLRCVPSTTFRDLPSKGWRARTMVTFSGRC